MTAPNRIDLVDALRGYALFGLFMVHMVERFELYWLNPVPDAWHNATFALFAGKAFSIFALLFGFSFATIMAGERARGGDFTLRFAWRLVLLFAIGTLHALAYRGDILQVLALVGLVLIPFDRVRSDRVLLILAALLFLELPLLLRAWAALQGQAWGLAQPLFWGDTDLPALATGSFVEALAANAGPGSIGKWSFYVENGRVVEIAGLFLVGMVLQRRARFAEAASRQGFWLGVLAAGAAAWALLRLVPVPATGAAMADTWLQAALDVYRALAATAFQVAAFVLLWHSPAGRLLHGFAPADDADTLRRPVAGLRAAVVRLRPGPVGRSVPSPDGADRPGLVCCSGGAGRALVPGVSLRPARMAVARRHAHQPGGAVPQVAGLRAEGRAALALPRAIGSNCPTAWV
jgi:uncharacterized protein